MTLPYFVISKRLVNGGSVYLPNLKCIDIGLKENFHIISQYYDLYRLRDACENPLSVATDMCTDLLLENVDGPVLYNANQLTLLNNEYPFFKLVSKDHYENY